ncbi:hypothetical protein BGZ46_005966 [Entomortierella lignicola]|nr:hypothetical protein BGZ46_005966 [Entomortierella lignicola]
MSSVQRILPRSTNLHILSIWTFHRLPSVTALNSFHHRSQNLKAMTSFQDFSSRALNNSSVPIRRSFHCSGIAKNVNYPGDFKCMRRSLDLIDNAQVVVYLQTNANKRAEHAITKFKSELYSVAIQKARSMGMECDDDDGESGGKGKNFPFFQGRIGAHIRKLRQRALNDILIEYGLSAEEYEELRRLRKERNLVAHPKVGHEEAVQILEYWKQQKSK